MLLSIEECERACADYVDCLQYNFRGDAGRKCTLMKSFRYGVRRDRERGHILDWELGREVSFTSGWMLGRIKQWRKDHTCKEADWIGASVERRFWET